MIPELAGRPLDSTGAIEAFLASRPDTCNARTCATYAHYVRPFAAWLANRPISAAMIGAYLAQRRAAQKSSATLGNDYRMLKTMCRWLIEQGLLDPDPFVGPGRVRPPAAKRKRRRTYTEADIVKLLAATFVQAANKRNPALPRQRWAPGGPYAREALQARTLILLLCDSALRAAEVAALTCGQARADEFIVLSKGGHLDAAFISDSTRAALHDLAGQRPDHDPLFRDWHGRACTTRAIRGLVERLARRAGVALPDRHVHAFRHWAARQWVKAKLNDLTIRQLMRHASLATTRIYTDLDAAELAALHADASPMARLLAAAEQEEGANSDS